MYVPPVVVLDYETALTDGTPSVDYFREDFRVVSAAAAWRRADGTIGTKYLEGEAEIGAWLAFHIESHKVPLVVHNFQFEYGVTLHRFPGFEGLITHDTMRLAQVGDNGGKQAAYQPKVETYDDLLDSVDGDSRPSSNTGLSLVACASRWLEPEWHNHKEPYHAWLREHAGAKKGQEGQHLTKLPPDMLEAYNVADAKVTLLLYETLTAEFARIGYDWRMDHELYKSTARKVSAAKGTGARVDVQALEAYIVQVQLEIDEIEARFRTKFQRELAAIESARHNEYAMALKTAKGQERRLAEEPERFNLGSTKQLKALFVDALGIQPKFWTKEPKAKPGKPRKKEFVPQPSFKSAHLSTYGEGGEIIRSRRKRLLVLQQAKALVKLAQHDGRWHFDLRACGTATGRMAGGRVD